MIKNRKLKGQYLIALCFLTSIILCSSKKNLMANVRAGAVEVSVTPSAGVTQAESSIDITNSLTKVTQNMLNTDSAVITDAQVNYVQGENQSITAVYKNLPKDEKIIAVLVDAMEGGAVTSQFLDGDGKVTFSGVKECLKIPQIHLYKQNPQDPDYLLHRENFIAKNTYLMPYIIDITNNAGLSRFEIPTSSASGSIYNTQIVPSCTLYTTSVVNIYSLALPFTYFSSLARAGLDIANGIKPEDVFAVIIAQDAAGGEICRKSVVSTKYLIPSLRGAVGSFCRFEFLLPRATKTVQLHIYKKSLHTPNFLCKLLFEIQKAPATAYPD